jgi:hypothetical protein
MISTSLASKTTDMELLSRVEERYVSRVNEVHLEAGNMMRQRAHCAFCSGTQELGHGFWACSGIMEAQICLGS